MLSFKHTVFLQVALAGSFTKASQVLFISQPAISKHIRQLEEEYGTALFERKGNGISLTEAGKVLLAGILEAKAIGEKVLLDLNASRDEGKARGTLNLGASTTVALYIVPPVLSAFHRKYPQVRLSLLNRNSDFILKALLDHEIDLGIIEGETKSSKVHSELFLKDEVVPVCSARSPLTRKPSITLKELPKLPVALREQGSGTLAALRHSLAEAGVKLSDLNSPIRLSGTEALKNFVLADECIGFLPLRSVEKELASGSLIRLFVKGLAVWRQFYFIQRHGDAKSGLSQSFVRLARHHYNVGL